MIDREDPIALCLGIADYLEAQAELFEVLELSGWPRHFRRDAALLRMRVENMTEALEDHT